ncbi:MAG: site-2 protease family protein [Candidatus Eremiobacteraeota bacterium]|nr:site-2 protease family protein [Candidatus Eremiobacteraeota bacterium]
MDKNSPSQKEEFTVCQRCGRRTRAKELFKPVLKMGVFYLNRSLGDLHCPPCAREVEIEQQRIFKLLQLTYWIFGLIIISLILGFSFMISMTISIITNVLLILLFLLLLILFHEISHAIAARILGGKIYSIIIGCGKRLFAFDLLGIPFTIGKPLFNGFTLIGFPCKRGIRLRSFLSIAAGPLFNLILALSLVHGLDFKSISTIIAWQELIFMTSSFLFISSIIPFVEKYGIPSDGMRMFRLIFKPDCNELHINYFLLESNARIGRKNYLGATEIIKEGLELYPDSISLKTQLAKTRVLEQEYVEALVLFGELLESGLDALNRAVILAKMAWCKLRSGDDEDTIESAYNYAKEAFEITPWLPEIQGIWGGALIERGFFEKGLKNVQEALELYDDRRQGIKEMVFASIAYSKLGKKKKAMEMMKEVEGIDPQGELIKCFPDRYQDILSKNRPE